MHQGEGAAKKSLKRKSHKKTSKKPAAAKTSEPKDASEEDNAADGAAAVTPSATSGSVDQLDGEAVANVVGPDGDQANEAARNSGMDDHSSDSSEIYSDDETDVVEVTEVLLQGSPRALVAFSDPVLSIVGTKTKERKTRIKLYQKIEPKLQTLHNLVGKAKIVGDCDPIPGRASNGKSVPLVDVIDSRDRLRSMPTTSYSIGNFSIDADSELAEFEQGLLDHLQQEGEGTNHGKQSTVDKGSKESKTAKTAKERKDASGEATTSPLPSSSQARIVERRLMVAIHNGTQFVTHPEYHSLHFKSSGKGQMVDTLSFKGTVVLPEVPVHPDYALILVLEYRVTSQVASRSTASSSKQSATYASMRQQSETADMREETIAVRWIPLIPAAFGAGSGTGPVRVEVPMLGGPVSTPEGSLMYASLAGDVNARFSLLLSGGAAGSSAASALAEQYSRLGHQTHEASSLWGTSMIHAEIDFPEEVKTAAAPDTERSLTPHASRASEGAGNSSDGKGIQSTNDVESMVKVQEEDSSFLSEAAARIPLPAYGTIGDLTGVVSRAVQAKLYNARFPGLIHEEELPGGTEVDAMQTMPSSGYLDLHKEATDDRQGNKISMQFLAFTLLAQGESAGAVPAAATLGNLFFTFRFGRFPAYRSKNMRLGNSSESSTSMVDGETRVLFDDTKPGFSVCYSTVSMLSAGVTNATTFAKYLGARSLSIEIWDSETLLLVGAANLDLAQLLRGGQRAIQAVLQLPVHQATVTREVAHPMADTSGVAGYGGNTSEPLASPQIGTLIMRVANVGQVCSEVTPSDGTVLESVASNAVAVQMDTDVRKGDSQTLKSTGKLMSDRNPDLARSMRVIKGAVRDESRKLSRFETIRKATPRHAGTLDASMREPRSDAADLDETVRSTSIDWLLSTGGSTLQAPSSSGPAGAHDPAMVTRNFPQNERPRSHRLEKPISSAISEMFHTQKVVHEFRQQHKQQRITSLLQKSITTSQPVLVSFGTPTFVEFTFKNILHEDGTFRIQLNDHELRLVQDVDEWRDFKTRLRTTGPIEEDMFQRSETGAHVLFLKAGESAVLPFVLRPLWSEVGPRAWRHQRDRYGSIVTELAPEDTALLAQARTVTMRCVADSGARLGQTVAILNLNVKPLPFRVDRVFRFWHKQHERIDKEIFLRQENSGFAFHAGGDRVTGDRGGAGNIKSAPASAGEEGGKGNHHHHGDATHKGGGADGGHPSDSAGEGLDEAQHTWVSAECSSQHVACEVVVRAGRTYVRVKSLMSRAPTIETFYVAIFDDEFKTAPVEIWQVFLHAVEEVYAAATLGATTTIALNVEGSQKTSLVQCFCSDPHVLTLQSPHGRFQVGTNTHTRAVLAYRPSLLGTARHLLHIVDTNYQRLVAAYLVVARVEPPQTTRQYAITVPVGKAVSKYVQLENAYPTERTYSIYTDRPDLVKIVHPILTLEGSKSAKITLRFKEMRHNFEVYVFVTNEADGKAEECFLIKATVSHTAKVAAKKKV